MASDGVVSGQPIPAIERIKLFSDTQWEEFVLEWADSLRSTYSRVERCGGSGDLGRDVVATCADNEEQWENFQCKHYRNPITPSDIWVELGKLVYYTHQGRFSYPRKYYFVAPQGVGTKLANLLKKPDSLREELVKNWGKHCSQDITSTTAINLEGDLKRHLEALDFSIFSSIPPLRLIDEHARTRWHVARFGGGLPNRPDAETPPTTPTELEAGYVRKLLEAYGDHLGRDVAEIDDVAGETNLKEHFGDSRIEFYSAESLRAFSRDTLPPGEFEKLQDEVHAGIRDEIRADHQDGYRRVVAVVKIARTLQLTSHALHSRISVRDHGGICHQLANDDKIGWVK